MTAAWMCSHLGDTSNRSEHILIRLEVLQLKPESHYSCMITTGFPELNSAVWAWNMSLSVGDFDA